MTAREKGPGRVLHVVHGWPPREWGGTESYAHWLAHWQSGFRQVAVHARRVDAELANGTELRGRDGDVELHELVNNLWGLPAWARFGLKYPAAENSVVRLVEEFAPNLIHIHHLVGHSLGLLPRLTRFGLPLIVQVQDWWSVCARVNLFQPPDRVCPGPTWRRCCACLPLSEKPWLSMALHGLRPAWARYCLGRASAFVTATASTLEGLGLQVPVHVVPYGVPDSVSVEPLPRPPGPLRCGYLGTVWPGKGVHIALEAFAQLEPGLATLEVWGRIPDPAYRARLEALLGPGASLCGPLPEERKSAVLGSFDVLLMPSLAAESYGLVAREALRAGVPVLAARQSALRELEREGALLLEPGSVPEWAAALRALARDAAELERLRARRSRPPSVAEHAQEIERIYAHYCS